MLDEMLEVEEERDLASNSMAAEGEDNPDGKGETFDNILEGHGKPDGTSCDSIGILSVVCRVPADDSNPTLGTKDVVSSNGETSFTETPQDTKEDARGDSGEKPQPRKGLTGRRLRAAPFKRKRFRPEPGTPSDSDSSDTKERRRQNVTTDDWTACKASKRKLEVATSFNNEIGEPTLECGVALDKELE